MIRAALLGLIMTGALLFSVAQPGFGRFGSAGRNSFRGPDLTNYNVSLFRIFPVGDRFRLELRGEVYNVTNSSHFANPNANINSLQFGQSTGLLAGYGPRTFQ